MICKIHENMNDLKVCTPHENYVCTPHENYVCTPHENTKLYLKVRIKSTGTVLVSKLLGSSNVKFFSSLFVSVKSVNV